MNYSNPTKELQEALEYNGDISQTDTLYTQTTDEKTTLNNPLVTPTKPTTTQSTKPTTTQSTKPSTYTPPLFGSLFGSPSINSSTQPKEDAPFSPFYRFWGHT